METWVNNICKTTKKQKKQDQKKTRGDRQDAATAASQNTDSRPKENINTTSSCSWQDGGAGRRAATDPSE